MTLRGGETQMNYYGILVTVLVGFASLLCMALWSIATASSVQLTQALKQKAEAEKRAGENFQKYMQLKIKMRNLLYPAGGEESEDV